MSSSTHLGQPGHGDHEELGYFFYHHPASTLGGYRRLDVILAETPTRQHFDPERFELTIVTGEGYLEGVAVTFPWAADDSYQVAPGSLDLVDRLNKKVVAYTFGGDLAITSAEHQTLAVLVSPAPILLKSSFHPLMSDLADRVEGLMAALRASLLDDEPGLFDQFMRTTSPVGLYLACLVHLEKRLHPIHDVGMLSLDEFVHALSREIGQVSKDQAAVQAAQHALPWIEHALGSEGLP